jgi:hypothetical protein
MMMKRILFSILLLALAGCSAATETSQSAGRTHFRHNGLRFALDVPAAWSIQALRGNVAFEAQAPRPTQAEPASADPATASSAEPADLSRERQTRAALTADVFTRTEDADVNLDAFAPKLLDLFTSDLRFQLQEHPVQPTAEPATVSGLPARLFHRDAWEGPVQFDQHLLIVAKGHQVWALVITVPVADRDSAAADVAAIEKSFSVW